MFKLNPKLLVVGRPVDSIPTKLSEEYPNDSGSMLSTHFFSINTLLATKLNLTPLIGDLGFKCFVKS
jgi:hypothetical protein